MRQVLDFSNITPAAIGLVGFVGGKWLHEKLGEPALRGLIPGVSDQDKDLIFNGIGILLVAPVLYRTTKSRELAVGYLIWNFARATKNLLARFNLESYLPVGIPF
ncbi:MAG: hypothetical protein QXI19_10450 [Candidatus Caldarchaeum sp.]